MRLDGSLQLRRELPFCHSLFSFRTKSSLRCLSGGLAAYWPFLLVCGEKRPTSYPVQRVAGVTALRQTLERAVPKRFRFPDISYDDTGTGAWSRSLQGKRRAGRLERRETAMLSGVPSDACAPPRSRTARALRRAGVPWERYFGGVPRARGACDARRTRTPGLLPARPAPDNRNSAARSVANSARRMAARSVAWRNVGARARCSRWDGGPDCGAWPGVGGRSD
ncbi:hypothetical protein DFJ74DRAFT_393782 [Hyaloraphidium curvatum]|nr:hypothetical protein DFJ74DRAFT_393782 [Hyaloraphidium curvatum]